VIKYVVGHGMPVADAVGHGRLHFETGILHAEPGFAGATLDELERRGYRLLRWKDVNLFFGGVQAVYRDSGTGRMSGGGDPRRGGAVVLV
jgi:gamma-glutamyltranspeptidase / glutathione hydrolase